MEMTKTMYNLITFQDYFKFLTGLGEHSEFSWNNDPSPKDLAVPVLLLVLIATTAMILSPIEKNFVIGFSFVSFVPSFVLALAWWNWRGEQLQKQEIKLLSEAPQHVILRMLHLYFTPENVRDIELTISAPRIPEIKREDLHCALLLYQDSKLQHEDIDAEFIKHGKQVFRDHPFANKHFQDERVLLAKLYPEEFKVK